MTKLEALRKHILDSGLGITPDNLATYIEDGKITSHASKENAHFQQDYKIVVIIDHYARLIEELAVVILPWIDAHYPHHSETPFTFDADVLNGTSAQVALSIPMQEVIFVETVEGGTKTSSIELPALLETCPNTTLSVTIVHDPQ